LGKAGSHAIFSDTRSYQFLFSGVVEAKAAICPLCHELTQKAELDQLGGACLSCLSAFVMADDEHEESQQLVRSHPGDKGGEAKSMDAE
jgi:hypothetical protein